MTPKADIGILSKRHWHVSFVNRIDDREGYMPVVSADDVALFFFDGRVAAEEECEISF